MRLSKSSYRPHLLVLAWALASTSAGCGDDSPVSSTSASGGSGGSGGSASSSATTSTSTTGSGGDGAGGDGAGGTGGGGAGGAGGGVDVGESVPVWVFHEQFNGGVYAEDASQVQPTSHYLPISTALYSWPALSLDGTRLAAVNGDDDGIDVYALGAGAPVLTKSLTGLATGKVRLFEASSCGDRPWMPGDGKLYYYAEGEGSPWVYRTVDIATEAQFTVAGPYYSCHQSFSSSTDWVAFSSSGVHLARTAAPAQDLVLGGGFLARFSADGLLLASKLDATGVTVHDLSSGAPVLAWSEGSSTTNDFGWSPGGRRLFVFDDDASELTLVNLAGGTPSSMVLGGTVWDSVRWSDSGSFLLARVPTGEQSVFDGVTGVGVTPAALLAASGEPTAVSRDDAWLLWRNGLEVRLTHLASGSTIPLDGTSARFSHDSTAVFSLKSNPNGPGVQVTAYLLSGSSTTTIGTFLAAGYPGEYPRLRTVAGSHYVFWESEDRRFWVQPVAGGQVKPARLLSSPVANTSGWSCGNDNSTAALEARCVVIAN